MQEILIHEDEKLKIYSITESVSVYPEIMSSFSNIHLFVPIYIEDKEKVKTSKADVYFDVLFFETDNLLEIKIDYEEIYEILKNYYEFSLNYNKHTYYLGQNDYIKEIKLIKEEPLSLIETFVLEQIIKMTDIHIDFYFTIYKFHSPISIKVINRGIEHDFKIPEKVILYLNGNNYVAWNLEIGNINYRILNPNREARQIDVEDTFDIMLDSITFIFDDENLNSKIDYISKITLEEFKANVVVKFNLYRIEPFYTNLENNIVFKNFIIFKELRDIVCVPDIRNEEILQTLIKNISKKENKLLKDYLILDALKLYKKYIEN